MNAQESHTIVQSINTFWRKPNGEACLDKHTAKLWLAELSDIPAADVLGAIRKLAKTQKWRPALSEIIEASGHGAASVDVHAMFASVRSAMNLYGATEEDKADAFVSPLTLAAVRRWGGWRTLRGKAKDDPHGFQVREFAEIVEDVRSMVASGQMRLEERKAIAPAPEAKQLAPAPHRPPVDEERLESQFAAIFGRTEDEK